MGALEQAIRDRCLHRQCILGMEVLCFHILQLVQMGYIYIGPIIIALNTPSYEVII